MERRKFVKNTSVAMGGIMISSSLAAGAYVDGEDVIRVGLIGCGGRGTGAAVQALSTAQNVKLVAMADAFKDQLDASYHHINAQYYVAKDGTDKAVSGRVDVPEEHKFVGFDAYKQVIPLVDVVVIATPPGFRPAHFEAAVDAGKHVFMEKPLATDAPGVRKVLAAAEVAKKKKLNVVVGLQRRYQEIYVDWVDAMQSGRIGEIVTSHVYWNGGGVWVRERKPGQTEMEYQMRNWYYFNWLCGDHITEQHIHNIDVSNWVKQAYPVSAYGMGGRRIRTGKDHGEIFDHHSVEFVYGDGSRMFSQCRHWGGTTDRVTESFQGTRGSAPSPGRLLDKHGAEMMNIDDRNHANPYQVEHDVLFEAIAKGEYKFADAEHGAKSTMTSILGRMATYSGQLVKWDEALNSDIDLMPEVLAWDANPRSMPDAQGHYVIPEPGKTAVI